MATTASDLREHPFSSLVTSCSDTSAALITRDGGNANGNFIAFFRGLIAAGRGYSANNSMFNPPDQLCYLIRATFGSSNIDRPPVAERRYRCLQPLQRGSFITVTKASGQIYQTNILGWLSHPSSIFTRQFANFRRTHLAHPTRLRRRQCAHASLRRRRRKAALRVIAQVKLHRFTKLMLYFLGRIAAGRAARKIRQISPIGAIFRTLDYIGV